VFRRLDGVPGCGLLPECVIQSGSEGEPGTVFSGVERIPSVFNGWPLASGIFVSAGQGPDIDRVDTEEVTGSNPVSPTR
jgi:hypothetical protein